MSNNINRPEVTRRQAIKIIAGGIVGTVLGVGAASEIKASPQGVITPPVLQDPGTQRRRVEVNFLSSTEMSGLDAANASPKSIAGSDRAVTSAQEAPLITVNSIDADFHNIPAWVLGEPRPALEGVRALGRWMVRHSNHYDTRRSYTVPYEQFRNPLVVADGHIITLGYPENPPRRSDVGVLWRLEEGMVELVTGGFRQEDTRYAPERGTPGVAHTGPLIENQTFVIHKVGADGKGRELKQLTSTKGDDALQRRLFGFALGHTKVGFWIMANEYPGVTVENLAPFYAWTQFAKMLVENKSEGRSEVDLAMLYTDGSELFTGRVEMGKITTTNHFDIPPSVLDVKYTNGPTG